MSKKLAIISGASSGIGLACAHRFLDQGFEVLSLSRRKPPSDSIKFINADFSQSNWIDTISYSLKPLLEHRETITLVHNSATMEKDSIADVSAESLRNVLQINLVAAIQLNQLCIPFMKSSSSILYMGSTLSEKAVANTASYVISKHALAGLMKCTVQDLRGTGIHSACICPGFTDTDMLREHLGGNEKMLNTITSMVSFGRLVAPQEIAELVFFSSLNPAVNGAMLHANLGQIES